jgi:Zn-dependent alcohol dehydrogenase
VAALIPDTRVGMIFGHEFTGVVEEVGSSVQNVKHARETYLYLLERDERLTASFNAE